MQQFTQFLFCPSFHRPLATLSFNSLRSLSVPTDFLTIRWFFWVQWFLLTFSFPLVLLVPFFKFLFSFFTQPFFHTTCFWGTFSCPFRCLKSFTNGQHPLCAMYSHIYLQMYSWCPYKEKLTPCSLILPSWLLPLCTSFLTSLFLINLEYYHFFFYFLCPGLPDGLLS